MLKQIGITKEGKAIYEDQGFGDRLKKNSDLHFTLMIANARKVSESMRDEQRIANEIRPVNRDYAPLKK